MGEHATPKQILIVDDEPQILDVLERYLIDDGFAVIRAEDGLSAVALAEAKLPDLVILDLKLPKLSGFDAFRRIRERSSVPIIMLTSRTEEVDRIVGLELGADDYITKPFSPREVVARVKAVLRRSQAAMLISTNGDTRLRVGDIELDRGAHEVTVGGRVVELTPTEFRLLEVLAENVGRTFSRVQLLDKIRCDDLEIYDRTLDRHVANLRQKIEPEPARPRHVLTVFGVGYKMAKPA